MRAPYGPVYLPLCLTMRADTPPVCDDAIARALVVDPVPRIAAAHRRRARHGLVRHSGLGDGETCDEQPMADLRSAALEERRILVSLGRADHEDISVCGLQRLGTA